MLDYAFILPHYNLFHRSVLAQSLVLVALLARMWLPALGVFTALVLRGEGLGRVKRAIRPPSLLDSLLAVSSILVAYTLSLLISGLLGLGIGVCGVPGLGAEMIALLLAMGVLAGITVNALAALGEEIAWRGFLLDELGPRLGFWEAVILIGVAWGLWHAPLILEGYNFTIPWLRGCGEPSRGLAALLVFTVFTVSLGALLSLLREATGNLYAAAMGHGTVNAIAGLYAVLVKGPRLLAPPAGLAVSAAFTLTTMLLLLLVPRLGIGARG